MHSRCGYVLEICEPLTMVPELIDAIADAYKLMDDREALKVLIRP